MRIKDPVCGMEFDAEKAVAQTEHEEKTYYFCSEACKRQFDANPERYCSPRSA